MATGLEIGNVIKTETLIPDLNIHNPQDLRESAALDSSTEFGVSDFNVPHSEHLGLEATSLNSSTGILTHGENSEFSGNSEHETSLSSSTDFVDTSHCLSDVLNISDDVESSPCNWKRKPVAVVKETYEPLFEQNASTVKIKEEIVNGCQHDLSGGGDLFSNQTIDKEEIDDKKGFIDSDAINQVNHGKSDSEAHSTFEANDDSVNLGKNVSSKEVKEPLLSYSASVMTIPISELDDDLSMGEDSALILDVDEDEVEKLCTVDKPGDRDLFPSKNNNKKPEPGMPAANHLPCINGVQVGNEGPTILDNCHSNVEISDEILQKNTNPKKLTDRFKHRLGDQRNVIIRGNGNSSKQTQLSISPTRKIVKRESPFRRRPLRPFLGERSAAMPNIHVDHWHQNSSQRLGQQPMQNVPYGGFGYQSCVPQNYNTYHWSPAVHRGPLYSHPRNFRPISSENLPSQGPRPFASGRLTQQHSVSHPRNVVWVGSFGCSSGRPDSGGNYNPYWRHQEVPVTPFVAPPDAHTEYLIQLLNDRYFLSVPEIERIMCYLQNRKEEIMCFNRERAGYNF